MDSRKEGEVWIIRSGGRFIITRLDCSPQCGNNSFEVFVTDKNHGFSVIVAGRQDSSFLVMSGILFFQLLPCGGEKDSSEHTVYGRGDNLSAINVYSSLVSAAEELEGERVPQTKASRVLQFK